MAKRKLLPTLPLEIEHLIWEFYPISEQHKEFARRYQKYVNHFRFYLLLKERSLDPIGPSFRYYQMLKNQMNQLSLFPNAWSDLRNNACPPVWHEIYRRKKLKKVPAVDH